MTLLPLFLWLQTAMVKVDWASEKEKKMAIKTVSKNQDVESFSVDVDKKILTISGYMDVESLVRKLRKQIPCVQVISKENHNINEPSENSEADPPMSTGLYGSPLADKAHSASWDDQPADLRRVRT